MSPEESEYLLEISKLSHIPVSDVLSVVSTQIAMILRDLGIKKEAYTVVGHLKLEDGKLIIITPNSLLSRYFKSEYIHSKIMEELPGIEY